ncbi:hypothetical protein QR680_011053 [Steinernema hermaphroditum]|uniref:Serine/threonine-protein phosphatase n=1 Tax=Steinernema hermaphroditum TaxID=289476 RepID=A0AA39MC69_9BILA|nr:hypothetical protein QR680_011053 [Steinernema hermaphroditum]
MTSVSSNSSAKPPGGGKPPAEDVTMRSVVCSQNDVVNNQASSTNKNGPPRTQVGSIVAEQSPAVKKPAPEKSNPTSQSSSSKKSHASETQVNAPPSCMTQVCSAKIHIIAEQSPAVKKSTSEKSNTTSQSSSPNDPPSCMTQACSAKIDIVAEQSPAVKKSTSEKSNTTSQSSSPNDPPSCMTQACSAKIDIVAEQSPVVQKSTSEKSNSISQSSSSKKNGALEKQVNDPPSCVTQVCSTKIDIVAEQSPAVKKPAPDKSNPTVHSSSKKSHASQTQVNDPPSCITQVSSAKIDIVAEQSPVVKKPAPNKSNPTVYSSSKKNHASEAQNNDPSSCMTQVCSAKIDIAEQSPAVKRSSKSVKSQMTQVSLIKSTKSPKKNDSEASICTSMCIDPPKFPREPFKLSLFIKKHLMIGDERIEYDYRDIFELLERALEVYQRTPALIDVPAPVNVCGDIHGQYRDLMWIFQACGMPHSTRFLFLGDYVDRGPRSVEVIVLLLSLKVKFPQNVFLLRGNHELKNINKCYGFLKELQSRFNCYLKLYEKFNEVFSEMPLAAIIRDKIICMHGGLSPSLNSIDDIRNIKKPLMTVKDVPLAQDLLWSDPQLGVKGFEPNKVRAVSYVFGEDAVEAKLKQLNLGMMIRAHQAVEFGYAFFAHRRLVTVFSASEYNSDLCNFAAVAKVDKELQVSFAQFKPAGYEAHRRKMEKLRQYTQDNEDSSNAEYGNLEGTQNDEDEGYDDGTQMDTDELPKRELTYKICARGSADLRIMKTLFETVATKVLHDESIPVDPVPQHIYGPLLRCQRMLEFKESILYFPTVPNECFAFKSDHSVDVARTLRNAETFLDPVTMFVYYLAMGQVSRLEAVWNGCGEEEKARMPQIAIASYFIHLFEYGEPDPRYSTFKLYIEARRLWYLDLCLHFFQKCSAADKTFLFFSDLLTAMRSSRLGEWCHSCRHLDRLLQNVDIQIDQITEEQMNFIKNDVLRHYCDYLSLPSECRFPKLDAFLYELVHHLYAPMQEADHLNGLSPSLSDSLQLQPYEEDLTCFIERIFARMLLIDGGKTIPDESDYPFLPQTWFCRLHKDFGWYSVLQAPLDNNEKTNMTIQISEFLQEKGVVEENAETAADAFYWKLRKYKTESEEVPVEIDAQKFY